MSGRSGEASDGWAALDGLILSTASRMPAASFGDIIEALPAGLHLRLVAESLGWLTRHGHVEQGSAIVDGAITKTFRATAVRRLEQAA